MDLRALFRRVHLLETYSGKSTKGVLLQRYRAQCALCDALEMSYRID